MGKSPARIWCEKCDEWQPSRSVPLNKYGDFDRENQQVTSDGIRYFRRLRECEGCGEDFETVEFSGSDFQKLLKATDAVKRVKKALKQPR